MSVEGELKSNTKVEGATSEVEWLRRQLEQKSNAESSQGKAEAKDATPWYSVAVGVLGIPALIIVMVMNFSAYQKNTIETDIQELKLQQLHKIQTTADRLEKASSENDLSALNAAAIEAVELLKNAQSILQKQTNNNISTESFVLRLIIAWIFLHFIGIVFSAFYIAWDVVSELPYQIGKKLRDNLYTSERNTIRQLDRNSEYRAEERHNVYGKFEKKRQRLDFSINLVSTVLRIFPRVTQVSLQVSILVILLIPLFNESARSLGSDIQFSDVIQDAKEFNVNEGLNKLRGMVIPSNSSSW